MTIPIHSFSRVYKCYHFQYSVIYCLLSRRNITVKTALKKALGTGPSACSMAPAALRSPAATHESQVLVIEAWEMVRSGMANFVFQLARKDHGICSISPRC